MENAFLRHYFLSKYGAKCAAKILTRTVALPFIAKINVVKTAASQILRADK